MRLLLSYFCSPFHFCICLQTQRPPRYIESNTGKSARQGNLTNYMHTKIRLVPFLTFIKETYKTLNKSGQSTNGDNCYKNLRTWVHSSPPRTWVHSTLSNGCMSLSNISDNIFVLITFRNVDSLC
jgi:hypothetical protein